MSYFKTTISRMQDYLLAKKIRASTFDRHPGDFGSAKTIGILFDATKLENRQIVLDYAEGLKKKGKKVSLLAYYNSKKPEKNFPFKQFTRKDLNLWRHPKGPQVKSFMAEPFDMLFSLVLKEDPAIEYIASLSKSHFRVGPMTHRTESYDLLVDTSDKKDLKAFIRQIEFLLSKMNNSSYESASL